MPVLGCGPKWSILTIFNRGFDEVEAFLTIAIGLTFLQTSTLSGADCEQLVGLLAPQGIELAFMRSKLHSDMNLPPMTQLLSAILVDQWHFSPSLGTSERIDTLSGYV